MNMGRFIVKVRNSEFFLVDLNKKIKIKTNR